MRKAEIHICQWFRTEPEIVFEYLLRPERLTETFPGEFRRLRRSPGPDPDGPGAVREIRLPGLRLREQITRCEAPEFIEYRLVGLRTLVRNHRGLIRFLPEGGGTLLDYRIELETRLPGLAAAGLALERPLRTGLEKLAQHWEVRPC